MTTTRNIRKVLKAKPTIEGAGVHLNRVFGFSEVPQFDPFLLLDDFRNDRPEHYLKGFPWHPHRGIETITYVLKGDVEHGDSMGNKGVITSGDVQWMTAGSGIIHQEMPQGDPQGVMDGFQLWANLPKSHKMMAPRYRDVKSRTIPEVVLANGAKIRVICGRVGEVTGPVQDIVIDPEYLDVTVPPALGIPASHPAGPHRVRLRHRGPGVLLPGEKPVFLRGGRGQLFRHATRAVRGQRHARPLWRRRSDHGHHGSGGGAGSCSCRVSPSGRPVAWYGPIVMNTEEELRVAFEEYQNGTFIKPKR